jgi:Fe-S cluster biogenesis protein NfuA
MENLSPVPKQLARIEELINAISAAPDSPITMKARELVQALMEIHGAGFEQALEIVHQSPVGGQALIDRLGEDPLISNLLILYNLHPLNLEVRVRAALELVKPRLGLHGGDIDLIDVTADGVVKLRLGGNCHGCPSSRVTLKSSVEEALYAAAPDITGMEVDGAVDNFVNAKDGAQPKFTVCPTTEAA